MADFKAAIIDIVGLVRFNEELTTAEAFIRGVNPHEERPRFAFYESQSVNSNRDYQVFASIDRPNAFASLAWKLNSKGFGTLSHTQFTCQSEIYRPRDANRGQLAAVRGGKNLLINGPRVVLSEETA